MDDDVEAYLRDTRDVSDFGLASIWKVGVALDENCTTRRGTDANKGTDCDAKASFQLHKVTMESIQNEEEIETQDTRGTGAPAFVERGKGRGRKRWLDSDSDTEVEAPMETIKLERTKPAGKENTQDNERPENLPSSWQHAIEISSTSEASEGAPSAQPTLRNFFNTKSPAPRKTPKMRRLLAEESECTNPSLVVEATPPKHHGNTPNTPQEDHIEEVSSLGSELEDDVEPDENMQVNHLGELCPVSSKRGGRGRGRGGAGKRSSGRWITDGSGKKVFVMSGGKRLSGSAAYKAYSGGNSKPPKKTRRRTKAARKPKKEK